MTRRSGCGMWRPGPRRRASRGIPAWSPPCAWNGLPLGFPDTPLGHGRPLPPCFLLGFSDTSTRSVAFGCYLAALWLFPRSTLLSSHPHKELIPDLRLASPRRGEQAQARPEKINSSQTVRNRRERRSAGVRIPLYVRPSRRSALRPHQLQASTQKIRRAGSTGLLPPGLGSGADRRDDRGHQAPQPAFVLARGA